MYVAGVARAPITRASYFTSTASFQGSNVQRETLALCSRLKIKPVHIDYDAVNMVVFLHTYNESYYVVDPVNKLMSVARTNSHTVRRYYGDIARTKSIQEAERIFYQVIDMHGIHVHGPGRLLLKRYQTGGELSATMTFAEDAPIDDAATMIRLDKNLTHSEHQMLDDLTHLMGLKALAKRRPIKNHLPETHNWW